MAGERLYRVDSPQSLGSVAAEAWDACAIAVTRSLRKPATSATILHLACVLRALEQSKSVGALHGLDAGTSPRRGIARRRLVACAQPTSRSHSLGEYVFDEQLGAGSTSSRAAATIRRYRSAVPFTPVAGRRLLVADDAPEGAGGRACRRAARVARGERRIFHSCYFLHASAESGSFCDRAGFSSRDGEQFHFINEGYLRFRRFSLQSERAQAKSDQARTTRSAWRRHRNRIADGKRYSRVALGRLLRLLHGHGRAKNGAVPI